jgi:hypothetical protein
MGRMMINPSFFVGREVPFFLPTIKNRTVGGVKKFKEILDTGGEMSNSNITQRMSGASFTIICSCNAHNALDMRTSRYGSKLGKVGWLTYHH